MKAGTRQANRLEIHTTDIKKMSNSRVLSPHGQVAVVFPRYYSRSLSSDAIASPLSRKTSYPLPLGHSSRQDAESQPMARKSLELHAP